MKTNKIAACVLALCVTAGSAVQAAESGILITDGDFESGIDGFGIAYSGREDTKLPYIFADFDKAASGNGSLKFVASETLPEKSSTSPQSLGIAYQGIYNADYISVESGRGYTVSADFYTESSGVKLRFIEMDGLKAVAMSPEFELEPGVWQTEAYKWTSDITTDKNRVRTVFYNIDKNASVYIDNFVYSADYMTNSSWKPDNGGKITETEDGFSYTAPAAAFKEYRGVSAEIDKSTLDANKEYVLSGYVTSDMTDTAVYVSADNANSFAEYLLSPGSAAYITLPFKPSECEDNKVRLSVTAIGNGAGAESGITLSGLELKEADTVAYVKQDGGKLRISGKLRAGNENRELTVNVTDIGEFKATSNGIGEYSVTCNLPSVEKSKEVFVSISGIGGYADCDDVIHGYTVIYNDEYRDSIAEKADGAASADALKSVLTDEALRNIGISRMKNFRTADRDFVLNYLLGEDISTHEKLEKAAVTGSALSLLADRRMDVTEAADKYSEELGLSTLAAYKNEYQKANKSTLDEMFEKCTTSIESIEDFRYVLTGLLVKEKAGRAVNNSEIMSFIMKYAGDMKLDFSGYNGLNTQAKYTVTNSFAEYFKNVSDFRILQNKLDALVKDAKGDGSGGGQGGWSGSGGSGGGGGGALGADSYERVEIEPTKREEPTERTEYNDLGGYEWAQESIYALLGKEILSMSEDGAFRPSDNITRAEFAKLVALGFGYEAVGADEVFDDVKTDDWYFKYVTALYENKIIYGISDSLFGADEPITRQDICTILARVSEVGEDADTNGCTLTDIDSAADYARAAIAAMNKAGCVNGYEDGSFRPLNNASRAEAAKLIYSITK